MGTDTLIDRSNGQIIDQDHINLINRVLKGDFVGRDSSGAATAGQNLGTASVPWGTAYITSLILDGFPIDPGLVTAQSNRVISGAVRPTSEFPAYLEPPGSGGGASIKLLATVTPFVIDVNGLRAEFTADVVRSGLTTAPATNNTCQINDTTLTGQDETRFLGENGTAIAVDNMGSELTSKIGEFVALLNQTTSEIMYCRIVSSTLLDHARRGFYFNSSLNPVPAGVLNNDDVLQILKLGFIFAENDGATLDVTPSNPVISGVQPSSPTVGDYWYDLNVLVWKYWTGSSFIQINRTFIGTLVLDTADCIGARPEYFRKAYSEDNTLTVSLKDVNTIISDTADFLVSLDGTPLNFDFGFFEWAASTDFETGFTRTASRNYWLYITEEGKPKISGYKPYDMRAFLRGWYHPYESWRPIGQIYNNASNQFEIVNNSDATLYSLDPVLFLPALGTIANNATDPNNDIDFGPRSFTFSDYTGRATITESLTKRLDANWGRGNNQGGLDTGTKAATSTYHCHVIYNPDTESKDYLFSLSAIAPTLPAGYTKFSRVWSILTDASANILGFTQERKYCRLDAWILEGYLQSIPTTRTTYNFSLPNGIKVRAKLNAFLQISNPSQVSAVIISDPDTPDQAPGTGATTTNFSLLVARGSGPANCAAELNVASNTSGQIAYRANNAYAQVSTVNTGWEDYTLEE